MIWDDKEWGQDMRRLLLIWIEVLRKHDLEQKIVLLSDQISNQLANADQFALASEIAAHLTHFLLLFSLILIAHL